MTGRCSNCRAKTVATPGPMNKEARPVPSEGWKRGYVIETDRRSYLVCADCLNQTLLAAA